MTAVPVKSVSNGAGGFSTQPQPSRLEPSRLETRRLTVSYGTRCVLRGVDLHFRPGAITALVGPSGCGKSTFLQALNRLTDLIPGCQVQGEVHFDGQEIHKPEVDLQDLRRRIGMIFQRPNPFPLSIRKNFALPLREHGIRNRDQIEAILERELRNVGLWEEVADRLESPATALSGGQQQRLTLARALALGPEVILLDEPCSALDPISSGVVEDLIASLKDRYTVVIVTHNLSQARRIADEAALFWLEEGAGRVVEVAQTEQFFSDPDHALTREYVSGARG